MANWVFEKRTRDGGASGEAVPNAVEAGGWSSAEELLIREAIQNSVDARKNEEDVVRVNFRVRHITGDAKAKLVKQLNLPSFAARNEGEQLKLLPGNALDKMQDKQAPLNTLVIEDFNTRGLGGALEGPLVGNYFKLLFVIGDGGKADRNDGSGGSFGFGKGVYAYNSNVRMIYAFSVFEPDESTQGVWARLLGCAYLPSHQFADVEWSGRAWYGEPAPAGDAGQSPYPLTNEAACIEAAKLGFSPRSKSETGTSILIVGCDSVEGQISVENLARAAETWWWPRLLDGKLDVALEDQGVTHPGLNPAGRLDLQPFIKARNCLLGQDQDAAVQTQTFSKSRGLSMGSLALKAIVPEDEAYEPLLEAQKLSEDRQGKSPAHKSIAYIRQPGMVVTYRAWATSSPVSAIGVYQAHPEIDRHLKLSEPVEHDRWDPHSKRLGALPHGPEIVKAVEDRCRNKLREFLKSLQPAPPPPKGGLDWLGKLLAQILTPRERGNPPPPKGERGDLSIQTVKDPTRLPGQNKQVLVVASYSIGLKPDRAEGPRRVSVSVALHTLEGDDSSRGDALRVMLRDVSSSEQSVGERPELEFELSPSERRIIEVESEEFSSDWAVGIQVEASSTAGGE